MKRIIFILLFYTTLIIYVSAQNISNVTAQQVDKTIHVTYNLDMQADIALLISMDGGRTFTELQKVYGAVGKDVRSGRVTIVWDVLAERESLVGDNIVFKVKIIQELPQVSTAHISSITDNSANAGGTVISNGSSMITARGICWSADARNPTLSNQHTIENGGNGGFTSNITGLDANTTYYVRAYATNGVGTSYGETVPFTTTSNTNNMTKVPDKAPQSLSAPARPRLPVIQTNPIYFIRTIADASGEIISDGGTSIIEKGICWSAKSQYPTIYDQHKSYNSNGNNFSVIISCLKPNTTYYVRAYATNSVGTAYGNTVVFTTPKAHSTSKKKSKQKH